MTTKMQVQYWRWYRPPVGRERTPRLSRYYMSEAEAAKRMPAGSYKSSHTEMRWVHVGAPPLEPEPRGCRPPGGVYYWHELDPSRTQRTPSGSEGKVEE